MLLAITAGCPSRRATTPKVMPTPSVQVGSCAEPGRDGVMSAKPKVDRADRDLNGDGRNESIVVDRALCTAEGNCYWNVFVGPRASDECARYAGTFKAAALEPLATKGEDNMTDVRGYWNLHGGRLSLETYRFVRGGYLLVEAVQCRRAGDDRLECMETQ
ncbi:MAG: hypothetical protein M4D80_03730 [Myxococcota bacterium]|nr:hypothetical protein [Myxococcota bacterium]